MKRFILSSLFIGLLLIAFTSCDKKLSQFTSVDGATAAYFPEPCLNWGCNASSVKSYMTSKGYTLRSSGSDGDYEYLDFYYGSYGIECVVDSDIKYWHAFCEGVTESQVKEIMKNYSNDNDYKKLGERSYEGGMLYAFQSKDNNTFIYAQAMGDDSCILYYSKRNAPEACAEWLSLFN